MTSNAEAKTRIMDRYLFEDIKSIILELILGSYDPKIVEKIVKRKIIAINISIIIAKPLGILIGNG